MGSLDMISSKLFWTTLPELNVISILILTVPISLTRVESYSFAVLSGIVADSPEQSIGQAELRPSRSIY